MASFKTGKVARIDRTSEDISELLVALDGEEVSAVGFPKMCGPLEVGDRVVVNTTGIELDLGTGGVAFVLWNLDGAGSVDPGAGHIMKMRYTPWQTEVLAAEAPESPHHLALLETESIDGIPVVVCGLHSQVGAAAAGIKAARADARIGYVMTDAASLPIAWSRQLRTLKEAGLIHTTCTVGHSFGGDLESVNVFSGLVALRHVAGVDVIVAAMGPGVVGTGTALGFTAIEQGQVCDAVTALGGTSIAALRISFVDLRERHVGISHHTLTALRIAARERTTVAVPVLPEDRLDQVRNQLRASGIYDRHDVVEIDGAPGLAHLAGLGIRPSSMGRTLDETPELFVAASAAGALAASSL